MPIKTTYLHCPVAVANTLILNAKRDRVVMDLLKVVKLIYLVHGWGLVFFDRKLMDEAPEAWPYGPVYPSLYYAFKRGGQVKKINDTQAYYEIVQGRWLEPVIKSDPIAVRVIDFVWTIYQRRSGEELSALAHQKGGAWDQVKQQQPLLRNANIPDALIKAEFNCLRQQYRRHQHLKVASI